MRKSFKTSIKVVILLVASILLGTFIGSSMHLTSDVFAEETKHKVYIYAVDNEHPDIFVDSFNVNLYDENGTQLYTNSATHQKDENTEVFELSAGNYSLKILNAPTSYHDSEGNTQRAEGFMYVFDSLETSFTVGDSDVYLELPISRKTTYTVDFEYQDVTDPSLTVYSVDGPPRIRIYDSNGKVFNAATNTFVEDLKLGDLPAPVNDPSGGTLTDKGGYYSGTEFGETSPGSLESYYWNGTEWIKYGDGQATAAQSTHYWKAEIRSNMSFDETQGKYIDNYYWQVDFYTQGFQNWQGVALEPGTYEADFSDTLLPYCYTDSEGQYHYTFDGTFYYVSEQKKVTFTITDQNVQSYVPVRRVIPHQVTFEYKDDTNPDFQFESPSVVIVDDEENVVSSADSNNISYQHDLKLSHENIPTADPAGGNLKWNGNYNSYDIYKGSTEYDSDPNLPSYYWNGTSWQTEKVYSSTGYWNAHTTYTGHWDEEQNTYVADKWYWKIEWEFNEYGNSCYLESGTYKLILQNKARIPTYYQDSEGNYHYGSSENFYYEYVNQEVEFTVTDSDQTVEIPIKKIQQYQVTINPTDTFDPTCTPNYFYYQLFNESGQIFDGNNFSDDLKIDINNMPTTDPAGGLLKIDGILPDGRKSYKGTVYDSEPEEYTTHTVWYWNGTSWQKNSASSSTPFWTACLQAEYHTDEETGDWVPYQWYWDITTDVTYKNSLDIFSIPEGNYTLRIFTVPEAYHDVNGNFINDRSFFYYTAEQSEIEFTVSGSDVTVDVPFYRHQKYEVSGNMKDSKDDSITYGDNIRGYILDSEGRYYFAGGFYENAGEISTPTTDPDGGELTYQYSGTYYGPMFSERQNAGNYYWNGTSWVDAWTNDPVFSLSGVWAADYTSDENGNYYWHVHDMSSDALLSFGDGNSWPLENGTYTFHPVTKPDYRYENGTSYWLSDDDVKPIQDVQFMVDGAETTFDIIIERVPKRKISLTIKDKDASYQINNNGSYRIRNLDTGKFVDQEGNEYELITASKADIPTTDPVGGSLTENGMDGTHGTYCYKGTEYDTEPEMSGSCYYWTGTEWVGSADFLDGCWKASISGSGHWDSEQGMYITDSWYWYIMWTNKVDKAYSGNPIATISKTKTGNYQVEEATTPTTYINPDGMTINGDVYKKAKPVQFTIYDDSPSVIDLEIVYERIPLSQAMPQAGERTALILTMIGCIAMIALAFTLSRPNRTR